MEARITKTSASIECELSSWKGAFLTEELIQNVHGTLEGTAPSKYRDHPAYAGTGHIYYAPEEISSAMARFVADANSKFNALTLKLARSPSSVCFGAGEKSKVGELDLVRLDGSEKLLPVTTATVASM